MVPNFRVLCLRRYCEEEALQEVKVAVSLWLEAARDEGRTIPKPSGREWLRDILAGKGATCGP